MPVSRAPRVALAAASVLLWTALVSAQPPPPAPQTTRDRVPPPPATGTGRISGRVVDARTGLPVARATVRLNIGAPGPAQRPPVATDETGAFVFTALPAGPFGLNVTKSGYLAAGYPQPAVRTMRSSINLRPTLADGQAMDGITIAMNRGGLIAGRVTDTRGEPAENVQVQIFFVPASGKGKPEARNGTSTNDLGEFRFAHLSPGSYLVLAQSRNQGGPQDDPVDVKPIATYYPGVTAIEQAQRIAIDRDQQATGIEIMMFEGLATIVTGTIVDMSGQPVQGASISVGQASADGRGYSSFGGGSRPDGTFKLMLPAGDYILEARGRPAAAPGGRPGSAEQIAMANLTAGGAPISGLTITLGPPAVVTGRVVLDGDSAPPTPEQMQVSFGGGPGAPNCRNSPSTQVKADWTFRLDNVIGTCAPRVNTGGRWTLKAVLHDDADIQERPVMFEPGRLYKDVQVVLTDRRTELALKVADEHGNSTREYVALVFPADKALWDAAAGTPNLVRTFMPPMAMMPAAAPPPRAGTPGLSAAAAQRPDVVSGLKPGEYYVIALDDLGVDAARDPDTFEKLAQDASRVTLTDRAPVSVALTRKTLPAR